MLLSRHKGRESLERDVALLLADPLAIQANPHRHDFLFERARERLLPESLFRLAIGLVLFATCECSDAVNFHDSLFRDGHKCPGCRDKHTHKCSYVRASVHYQYFGVHTSK